MDSHGAVLIAVYRIRPRAVRPYFRMFEIAGRYLVITDPRAGTGTAAGPDEDGAEALTGFVPRTTREIHAGVNYYVNLNVRFMANVIVPTDARPAPDAILATRLQVVF